jgi:DNA-binding MarR family transcriptional regulator
MSALHQGGAQGISIGALAEYLEVTGAHVTIEIGKLAAAGLVRKVANPRDGRGVLVHLTRDGEQRIFAAYRLIRAINDRLFADISTAEFKALRSFSEKFVKNTETALLWAEGNASANGKEHRRAKAKS